MCACEHVFAQRELPTLSIPKVKPLTHALPRVCTGDGRGAGSVLGDYCISVGHGRPRIQRLLDWILDLTGRWPGQSW